MYLVGGPHTNKGRAQQLVRSLIQRDEHLATDAEVLQEVLHRYHAINRHEAIGPAIDVLKEIVDTVFPISADDVIRARAILESQPSISARHAIHAAIMDRYEITEIVTFDERFDLLHGIRRIQ